MFYIVLYDSTKFIVHIVYCIFSYGLIFMTNLVLVLAAVPGGENSGLNQNSITIAVIAVLAVLLVIIVVIAVVLYKRKNRYAVVYTFYKKPIICQSFNFLTFPEIQPEIFLTFAEINRPKWVTLSLFVLYTRILIPCRTF